MRRCEIDTVFDGKEWECALPATTKHNGVWYCDPHYDFMVLNESPYMIEIVRKKNAND
jgi:hypothetical protein